MELPHLGKNCALKQCNQLDFLPVKCDACSKIFCLRHYQYDTHNCEKAKNKDVQVPVCPLCSEPVPSRNNQLPDVAVSRHMDQYCKQNESIRDRLSKPKTNLQACTFRSCRQKDVIYLECRDCQARFCIKHRHPTDHQCPGPSLTAASWQSFKGSCSSGASSGLEMLKNKANQISKSGQAAINRLTNSNRNGNTNGPNSSRGSNQLVNTLQGNLNEQEALAIALNESKKSTANAKQHPSQYQQQEDEDLALARALHESQLEARSRGGPSSGTNKDTCILS